jgi:uracil-DNA glycosylase
MVSSEDYQPPSKRQRLDISSSIPDDWYLAIASEFDKPYFQTLQANLKNEINLFTVYPPQQDWFSFMKCSLDDVKVVIIGQDPYHQPGQAHGLCFSVQKGVKIPPSLRNIYRELSNDIQGFVIPDHGCLNSWCEQGVLLLNATLTVRKNKANSHCKHQI